MNIRKITATGRPVDPSYSTNRVISIVTILVLIGGILYHLFNGTGILLSLGRGLGIAASVFLTWAITREIDPDHDLSAFVAAVLALGSVIFLFPPDFVGLIWLLLILRIINHSTGLSANIFDTLIITGLSVWLTVQGNWIYGSFTVIALLSDGWLDPKVKKHIYFATLNAIFLLMIWIFKGFSFAHYDQNWPLWGSVLILAVLIIPLLIASRRITSKGDDTGILLNPVRVQVAQIFAIAFALLMILYRDFNGLKEMMPLFASLGGVVIYYYYDRLRAIITGK